ncbi:preprotein translocase subunit SecG [Acidihalobacter prosperus]|uniref:Protein-export membrane protein SecG n=1 Tax=Acidihalobacter prosperus TaxID=160660 RepID=A0A1A6C705_9GAMM|nr:preprotein translocase subunit SecG [Acidihalobacter prosperus]OBS10343.1 Preprotein translocase subunit SecG [Acidihalobacter prosperus]
MLYTLLIVLQVVVAIAVIVLVLLQHGKGADAGAAFGSGASGTVFGARGSASFLSRATAALATVFFLNCLGLAYLAAHQNTDGGSVVDQPGAKSIIGESGKPAATTPVPSAGGSQAGGKSQ